MSIKDALRQRRSIRKYTSQPVPDALVLECLEAAGWAPSAHNAQPWRFIVVSDSAVKHALAEAMAKAWMTDLEKNGESVEAKLFNERVERFSNAPTLILACLTMEGLRVFPDKERQITERDLALESLGAGLENLLLAADAEGLGVCWFCAPAFCKDTIRRVLDIPVSVEPSAFIVLGYPAEAPKAPNRKAVKEYCFRDGWGKPL